MKFVSVISLLLYGFGCGSYQAENNYAPSAFGTSSNENEAARLKLYAIAADEFCVEHDFDNSVFFLADMSVHSGRKRFFVYDIEGDSVISSSMVAHGACGEAFLESPDFANDPGCGCSSLGKYKIGNKYVGRFGDAYKLYGLDSSNSNAFLRNIVLHSYYEVPDYETYPDPICNSLGCPMVSNNFLKQLEMRIDLSPHPILLWIVN